MPQALPADVNSWQKAAWEEAMQSAGTPLVVATVLFGALEQPT
jgi:hypothetical protein